MNIQTVELYYEEEERSYRRNLTNNDDVIVTRIHFNYKNKPREIKLLSYKIGSDLYERESLPWSEIGAYHWLYLSAEGVGLFSKVENGLNKTTKQLVELLYSKGAVILDYPGHKMYNNCSSGQEIDGIKFMCGRENLSDNTFKLLLSFSATKRYFGYVGIDPKDQIRIYQKR